MVAGTLLHEEGSSAVLLEVLIDTLLGAEVQEHTGGDFSSLLAQTSSDQARGKDLLEWDVHGGVVGRRVLVNE